MPLEGLLNNLHNSIDLSHSNSADFVQLRNVLISLRHTPCNNYGFLDLLGFADHTNECVLRRINHSTAVDQHKVCLISRFDNFVAVVGELADHELAV